MKPIIFAAGAAVALALGAPASASLIVSGDTNIFAGENETIASHPGNARFLSNIAGTNVLIQDDAKSCGRGAAIGDYLASRNIAYTLRASTAALTASDFAGRTSFIGILPASAYTADELAGMAAILGAGGNVLLAGEYGRWDPDANANINTAFAALGSALRIGFDINGAGYETAVIATDNAITRETAGFQLAAYASVSGGTALYAGRYTGLTVLASEELAPPPAAASPAPEPASWAMFLGGFGLVGGALRQRRRAAVAFA